MAASDVVIRGAREHNLRDVSLTLPRGRLICLTGVSGSGKSSLAFDTLYAEGQRRYVESLSSYARQFLGQMSKPDVDRIEGLSPSISIQQKTGGRNPRSTVGTITEINDYLRVLFARVGQGHCPRCDRPVAAQTREQIVARILDLPEGTPFSVMAPVVRGQKGEYKDLFVDLAKAGYVRARVDGQIHALADDLRLDRQIKHDIEVVIDRLKATAAENARGRLAEAVEQALKLGEGTLLVAIEGQPDLVLSAHYACTHCGIGFDPPSPQLFSFNSPQGMCPACDGLGIRHDFDPALLIPDPSLSVWEGAIAPLGAVKEIGKWRKHLFEGVARNFEADADGPAAGTMLRGPWSKLDEKWRQVWLYGAGDRTIVCHWKTKGKAWTHPEKWPGVAAELLDRYKNSGGGPTRSMLEPFMRSLPCPECKGARLNARARAVRVGGRTLVELSSRPIGRVKGFFDALAEPSHEPTNDEGPPPTPLDPISRTIAEELLKEIRGRLGFLIDVGLHYLSLDRSAPTLSGGEAQRIRLASQVGAGLVGVLYILDEPSIGLHSRDNDRLISALQRLRDVGNTVIVVEHDEDTMRAADWLVDFGPGPGVKGGEVVAQGDLKALEKAKESLTGAYLSGKAKIEIPRVRKVPDGRALVIRGARQNNLRGIDVAFPLGLFVCVTGVSGSGKSSLVGDILRDALTRDLNGAQSVPGEHDRIEGLDQLDKVIDIDQAPIGRTPRSNAATYIKLWDLIRDLYTKLPDSRARGYQPGRFSFNVAGGRCEACEGNGSNKLEMDFLADVWVVCPVCEGRRFTRETLHVRYKGKSISDVLQMDVQEALEHFANVPKIAAMLQTLHDVGLDYLKLGQASPTLSGGEAQRIKLARELVRKGTGKTLYILDEPTTGLHFEDVRKLLAVLRGFTERGNTVVVVEHNLDVVKTADWLIDLGPEGGAGGGQVVAQGPPEAVAQVAESHTGRALERVLKPNPRRRVGRPKSAAKGAGKGKGGKSSEEGLDLISVRGARQHNLKGFDLDLPRNKMTVCSGPSGSGKSSLAIDTLYAEGQRRYVESLSSYARQFLAPLPKPRVEKITGLSPAVCIEQKTTSKSPRSTVGTVTEIHDYLRILVARLGDACCPSCGLPIGSQTSDEIIEKILQLPEGSRVHVMAPVDRRETESYDDLWLTLKASGFARARVDGRTIELDAPPKLSRRRKHQIEVVVDRAVVRRATRARLADAVESALDLGKGVVLVARVVDDLDETKWPVDRFSQHRSCDRCGRSFEELSPHHFSFNSPLGWCPVCEGLGVQQGANPAVLIPDPGRSLRDRAVAVWPDLRENQAFGRMIEAVAHAEGIDLDLPFDDLEGRHRRTILHGRPDAWYDAPAADGVPGFAFQYKGLFPAIEEAGRVSFQYRWKLQGLVDDVPCASCMGARLRDDAAAVRFRGLTLDQINRLPLGQALEFFEKLDLDDEQRHIAGDLVREVHERLSFLVEVGLDYLSLARGTPTLSGGESQRIRLASQIGSGLTGVLYVLDEPTIGLHPRDNGRLLGALKRLRDLGNTVVLVEHDREIIEAADALVDFGPGSGRFGGEVTAVGPPARVAADPNSLTGAYLSGSKAIPIPTNRRPAGPDADVPALVVKGARHNNLKDLDVRIPLGVVTVVTGVSGSGKSTLVEDVLWKTAARVLHRAQVSPGAVEAVLGLELIDKVIRVDQSPLGGTPNSTAATYSGAFDLIRELFAKLPESKVRGYTPRRFSFNMAGGRCEACEGAGQKRIEMHFLPDVWVVCESCKGRRFTPEVLAVSFRGKAISDVLDMSVDQALELFDKVPRIKRILQTLHDVGLGYLPLGQSAPTLSGGEAQRVKLASELSRPDTGRTLYVLDEPTTGLHVDDVRKLLDVIHRLADLGNSVVVIEHNLDVVKTSDWVIDLGPEAGRGGGEIVAEGPPETVAACKRGYTSRFLRPLLAEGPFAERLRFNPKEAAKKAAAVAKAARLAAKAEAEAQAQAAVAPTPARGAKARANGSAESPNPAVALAPWERDGRKWHTEERTSRNGRPARWDGQILGRIVDRLEELGRGLLAPTDWNQRGAVRIGLLSQNGEPDYVFFQATTGGEWIVTLRVRVPRNTFQAKALAASLGLVPFHEAPTPVLSDAPRLKVSSTPGAQEITITGHTLADFQTPAFDEFLGQSVKALHKSVAGKRLVKAADLQ
ncbi:excinuclease ABC subunit UvrA [Planctomyces sp. SH-PL62]|uniref:excinuclease ABC subunit UvrA n=1 Tax=Planctomyces sp. SH-PL62 TaxID=1636152 RepID=UPI00078D37EC|nr:excinuclease ABC subunit UvrA [Planctomyces sp. SH-PL62]AMV37347.1 UvrABC system protein A [Planctomyces sp. SH-PL62]